MNSHTDIRYHIYKEFNKYNKSKRKDASDRINEFSIPILTGVIVFLMTEKCLSSVTLEWYVQIGLIFPICLIYAIILKSLKWLLDKYENCIKPNLFAVIKKTEIEFKLTQEESAAKFNYEVTYLTQYAYKQLDNLHDSDSLVRNLTIIKIIFHVKNALRKTDEALTGYTERIKEVFVYTSMIEAVMDIIYHIILRILDVNKISSNRYTSEVNDLIHEYNKVIGKLNKLYCMQIKIFKVPEEYRL